MAVTVVDAPITTADAYPAAITVSGAATGLIVAVGHSVGFGDASGPSSVSMGGQSLTQIGVAEGAASSGHDVSLSFWALNETKIAAASNTTLSFSGGNQTGIATAYFTVAGSVDVETLSASGNISTATTGSVSLARSAGSLTFACSLHDNASFGFSNLSNPAEDNEITATNIDFVYGVEADTARTVDFTWDNASSRNNSTLVLNVVDGLSPPTISNVDGDNAVNQGQLVNINVADFTESITSGDIGGIAFPSIPDNDPADDVIQVRMPVTLAAGTYDVTISGATETDTISGVTYAITHQYTAPYAPVDNNSLFAGQSLTDDSYFRIVTPPANGTIDAATAEANSLWGNDVDDIYTPDNGFTGDDTVTLEILYADGTTAQWTATISVTEPDTVGPIISIGAINTTDTTPTASGSAGDSDSLTLDLDGVDVTHTSSYNITPSGGSWSQQFPELAIGTYTMTLTGVDTTGNETVETATLQIVEPSTSPSSKLLRQLLRGSLRSSLKLS